ncbi:MAG: response regulator [Eudoraea sp.]|nr:response regulator [Eudoraea sp.]
MIRVRHISLQFGCLFFLACAFAQLTDKSQPYEVGLPYITYYSPEDYDAFTQNWGAVQDHQGVMYFANGDGVLTYNGVHWEVLELPNQSHAKSIAIDRNNRVYVGASHEFGYLQADASGKIHYVSMLTNVPVEDRNFGTVWSILIFEDTIFFRTDAGIYLWNGDQFTIWKSEDKTPRRIFSVNGKLFASFKNNGLMSIENGSFKTVLSKEETKGLLFNAMLAYDADSYLLATLDKGLYFLQDGKLSRFTTEIDDFFQQNSIYKGLRLSNGTFAFGTFSDGLVVIDQLGRQQFRYNAEMADAALMVLELFQDKAGILWVCLSDGVLKLEYPSPFTFFDKRTGINSRVQIIRRYQNRLLTGTANGLYALETNALTKTADFKVLQSFNSRIWDLLVFDDLLLIAEEDAVYQFDGKESKKIDNFNASAFLRSAIDPNRVFISLSNGLRSIYYNEGQWKSEGKIDSVQGATYTIIEEAEGDLWLETSEDWIWNISFSSRADAKRLANPVARKFTKEQGLPGTRGDLYLFENNVYFVSANRKTYQYDRQKDSFEISGDLNTKLELPDVNLMINHIDDQENIWFSTFTDSTQTRWFAFKNENAYELKNLNQTRILDDLGGSETLFYEERDSVLWLTGNKSVIRHDLALSQRSEIQPALIAKVIYKKDSILREGYDNDKVLSLPYQKNSFRFYYSSTSFYDENKNQFQYILEGFDENWSDWSKETQKDYTNIPEGAYDFRVRAKNILGQISEEDSYGFAILPPWYRRWWIYIGYVILAGLALWGYGRWRSTRLRKKNLALEALVADRTEKIRKKNKMLSYQTEKLKELDTMKTRLFANISHEFRTPLTLIKGPVEKLESEGKTQISMPNIKMIRRNANRLLNLVNQLLDLSKLDSGKLKLNKAEGDLFKCLRAAASTFSSHAAARNMDYQLQVPSELLWASFDRDKLEKIVYNLLSNAFKFTEDEGRVILEAEHKSGQLNIIVSDTGTGIPIEKLPRIFDRFFQVDDSFTREKAGSGIGLALTKELVELMGGTIFVESKPGKGTQFKVVLPLEKIETGKRPPDEIEIAPVIRSSVETNGGVAPSNKQEGPQILIIEDNNDMRFFIGEQLESQYAVSEAVNGKEGLDKAHKMVPDLIITDLMMPQMDGITLCKELKSQRATSHIPVIMLTAKAGMDNKLEGLETGADDYLTKPFNARELQLRVKNLIEQRAKLRELYSRNISLDPKQVAVTSVDEEFLEEVLAIMEEKYMEASFGPIQLQKRLAMSKTQLHRKLKALTDTPPSELLRNFRLKRAAQLLTQRKDNISQVAYDVGFNSLSYFTKCFKDLYGITPTQYVEKGRKS